MSRGRSGSGGGTAAGALRISDTAVGGCATASNQLGEQAHIGVQALMEYMVEGIAVLKKSADTTV